MWGPTLIAFGLWLGFLTRCCAWDHVSANKLQSTIEENDVVVVAFVNPSDEISRHLELEWPATTAEAEVPFISIDCAAGADICDAYGVPSHTVMKLLIRDKEPLTYVGPRRASAILAWLARMQRPVVTEITAESLGDFKHADETVYIAYLDADDEHSKAIFSEAAAQFRTEFTFGLTSDTTATASEGAAAPVVRCYKPLDGDTRDLAGGFADVGVLGTFIKDASRPVISELLPHNHQRLLDRGWPMVYVFARTEPERAALRSSLRQLARDHYDSLTMATVDPLEFPDLPARLGLDPLDPLGDGGGLPAGAVHQLSADRIYPYPRGRGFAPAELQSWGLDVWQGRAEPWTPPGTAAASRDAGGGGGGRIEATRKVSMRNLNIPGVNIRVAGRDEL